MWSVVTLVVGICLASEIVALLQQAPSADGTTTADALQRRARRTRAQSTVQHVAHRHQGGQLKGILEAPGSLVRIVYEDRFDTELAEMEAALVVFADPTNRISSKTDPEVRPRCPRADGAWDVSDFFEKTMPTVGVSDESLLRR
jgi:hypothetical protein